MSCPHPFIASQCGGACPICAPDPAPEEDVDAQREALLEDYRLAKLEVLALTSQACRLSLAEFVKEAWHVLEPIPIEWNWHLDALCANIQGMLDEFKRCYYDSKKAHKMRWQKFIQNLCPGTLKSRILMVFAPAWMWIDCPWWQVFCTSCNMENVKRDSEGHRDLVTSSWYRTMFGVGWTTHDVVDEDIGSRERDGEVEGADLRDDIASKAKFANSAGGMRISRGLKATSVGIHVHCIFIDDPDDLEEVQSEAARDDRRGRIKALGNRLIDQRCFVFFVLQQRVHIADATGELLEQEEGWWHCNYPLFYSEKLRKDSPFFIDPRSEPDENLHPARFTDEVVAKEQGRLKLNYRAQYQGDPVPEGGIMFDPDCFQPFDIWHETDAQYGDFKPPGQFVKLLRNGRFELDWLYITIDGTMGSTTAAASEVGMLLIGGRQHDRFIFRDKTRVMEYPEAKAEARALYAEFPEITGTIIEEKATGLAMIQELKDLPSLIAIKPTGTKPQRAKAMQESVQCGNWYVLRGQPWIPKFKVQFGSFPASERSDRVDAASQLQAHVAVQGVAQQQLEKRLAAYRKRPMLRLV